MRPLCHTTGTSLNHLQHAVQRYTRALTNASLIDQTRTLENRVDCEERPILQLRRARASRSSLFDRRTLSKRAWSKYGTRPADLSVFSAAFRVLVHVAHGPGSNREIQAAAGTKANSFVVLVTLAAAGACKLRTKPTQGSINILPQHIRQYPVSFH